MCQGDDASILKETSAAYRKLNYDEASLEDAVDRAAQVYQRLPRLSPTSSRLR